jgi:hypothetical protein
MVESVALASEAEQPRGRVQTRHHCALALFDLHSGGAVICDGWPRSGQSVSHCAQATVRFPMHSSADDQRFRRFLSQIRDQELRRLRNL